MHFTKQLIASAVTIISIFIISGCQSAMSTSNKTEKYTTVPNEWPLQFEKHNFVAYCYDTVGCSVLYNDDYFVKDDEDKVTTSSSSYGPSYQKNWGGGAHLGIKNFPSPAVVSWKTKEGDLLVAKIDIAEIFKDQRILHNVTRDELPTETVATVGDPTIILEVNNRTINVYMREMIYLKDSEARHGDFRDEVILAYSHTY